VTGLETLHQRVLPSSRRTRHDEQQTGPGQNANLLFGAKPGKCASAGKAPPRLMTTDWILIRRAAAEIEDALRGAERQISYRHLGRCDACNGTGSADAAAAPVQCAECRGSGQVRTARNTLLGQFVTTSTCPRCGGDGTIVKNACKVCRGRGRCELERSVSVKIPAGVEDGMQLRHAGMGEAGERGGQPGDLYVFVSVRPNGVFEREGPNLRCDTEVSFTQAALGARLEIDGLDGPVRIDIPAGAQNGSVFRIGGRGLPRLRGSGRGDLFVEIRVRVPTKLTRKQRELLEAFAHAGGEDAEDKKSAKNVRGAFGN